MKDDLDEFFNALQLSIQTPIDSICDDADGVFEIYFEKHSKSDQKLKDFMKLVGAALGKNKDSIRFNLESDNELLALTDYLYLTRLDRENMKGIATFNKKYCGYLQKILGKEASDFEIRNLGQVAEEIFSKVREKNMTLRELSEKTGLTQLSLSRFKAGNDIRLSNFFKITGSLGLKVSIKEP